MISHWYPMIKTAAAQCFLPASSQRDLRWDFEIFFSGSPPNQDRWKTSGIWWSWQSQGVIPHCMNTWTVHEYLYIYTIYILYIYTIIYIYIYTIIYIQLYIYIFNGIYIYIMIYIYIYNYISIWTRRTHIFGSIIDVINMDFPNPVQ